MKRGLLLFVLFASLAFVGCLGTEIDIAPGDVELQLLGEPEMIVLVGESFDDPGVVAIDSVQGDISSDVVVGGDVVETATCGTYVVTYEVQDSQGATVEQVQRVVQVVLQFDDFEGLDFSDMDSGRYWGLWDFRNDAHLTFVDDNGRRVLSRDEEARTGAFRLYYGGDIRFRYQFKFVDIEGGGIIWKRLRRVDSNEYRVTISQSGVSLTRRLDGDEVPLASGGGAIEIGRWYELETKMYDRHFRVYLDGERIIDHVDNSGDAIVGHSEYRHSFEGWQSWAYYDNLLVACVSEMSQDPIDPGEPAEVGKVTLTYPDCPHTTMRISWKTDSAIPTADITYSSDLSAEIDSYTKVGTGTSQVSAYLPDTWIHWVELTNLTPGTDYAVAIPSDEGYETFTFYTLPENAELRFLVGADSHVWEPGSDSYRRRLTNALAADFDPDFIIKAGDLWYGDSYYDQVYGPGTSVGNVMRWLDDWHDKVITADGRRIPIVPAKGNHDRAFYNEIFPNSNYYVLQFGADLTLITLNSGHGTSTGGAQRDWLEQTLQDYQDSKWLLVQFHVTPYPSYRDKSLPDAQAVHEDWLDLFDQYGVDLVLVGHDHTYHRTYPLFDNEINYEDGVIYLGVTMWVGGRPVEEKWYLKEQSYIPGGFFEFTLSADTNELTAQHYSRYGAPHGMQLYLYKE